MDPLVDDARRTDTRERILEVSARLFADRSFAGTSIKDISDELGLTKAALYYHFASKEAILHELVDEPIAAIRKVLETPGDLSNPEGRKTFVRAVVGALSDCDPVVIGVFKDPRLAQQVNAEIAQSGISKQIAGVLAYGMSGVADPADIPPTIQLRAHAAVMAGQATLDYFHEVYPDRAKFSEDDKAVITDIIVGTLEG